MFYAVLALLILLGKSSTRHSGVIALFDEHFVKTGLFPTEMSRWLHRAFDLRQVADYRELAGIRPERVDEVLRWAGDFVERVSAFLEAQIED